MALPLPDEDRLMAPILVAVAAARLGCLLRLVGGGFRIGVAAGVLEDEEEEGRVEVDGLEGEGERDGSGCCCWEAEEREETVRVMGRGVADEGKEGGG